VETLLIVLTGASLVVAGAMAFVAWRLSREERERSAARVAALTEAIDGDDMPATAPLPGRPAARGGPEPVAAPAWDAEVGRRNQASDAPRPASSPRSQAFETGNDAAATSGLFATATASGDWRGLRVAPALLAGTVIVGSLIGATWLFTGNDGTASAATAREPRPLELLSLRHEISPETVIVTGLVRNPASNAPHERLTAVVFLFDGKGGFLASGRAPLDFTSLGSGEDSPFVVAIKAPAGVARYRVSFRKDEGGVVPHVDRRKARQP
jgi:hypothetical protein